MDILVILILILINGFFSLSEIAVISAKVSRLEQKAKEGSSGAKIALKLRKDSDNFLSSVQVGITLVGLITGAFGGISLSEHLTPVLEKIPSISEYATPISFAVIMILTTYVTIVFGELVPKTMALSKPDVVATKVSPIINIFSKIFFPFVKLLSFSTNAVTKLLGIKEPDERMTEYELKEMMRNASLEGVIEEDQNEIHEKVFYFSDKKAQHLMTHRMEIEWIDLDETINEIAEDIKNATHSKVLCCHESIDNFIGVLNLRDYYKLRSEGNQSPIKDMITKPAVIHEKTTAIKVLENLRKSPSHFCVVVDEYGDFEGIITFHDIMEHIVGAMPDDGEIEEPDFVEREDGTFLVNGDAPVELLVDIIEDFDVDFETIDYATVAGFVIEQTDEMPKEGHKFQYANYEFEVVDMDGNRIDKLLLSSVEINKVEEED